MGGRSICEQLPEFGMSCDMPNRVFFSDCCGRIEGSEMQVDVAHCFPSVTSSPSGRLIFNEGVRRPKVLLHFEII